MMGMSPETKTAAKQFGEYMEVRMVKHRKEHSFTVEFLPKKSPEEMAKAQCDLAKMVDVMVENFGTQLYSFFGIGGEIQDVE
jgi:hypothetical protein